MTNSTRRNSTWLLKHAGILVLLIFLQGSVEAQNKKPAGTLNIYSFAKAGTFMRNWLVAGPVVAATETSPTDSVQQSVFREDLPAAMNVALEKALAPIVLNGKTYDWKQVSSATDIVDLDKVYPGKDFAYAYASAEIEAAENKNVLLALGSDDAVKVWHNGKLVHENWVPRGAVKDNDLVPLQLVKGTNRIILKIQDMEGGWAFVVRLLDKASLSKLLVQAARDGNVDKINMLLAGGADINAAQDGLTPIAAAKISGRDELVKILMTKGATDQPVPAAGSIVDATYNMLKEKKAPGIAILVARDKEVLYRKGFGYADIQGNVQVTPETKFRIGSVTKQFTAAAILKLQEQQLLSVNDKLSRFIPGYPQGDSVTIHQLLTHTSGIHSYTGKGEFINRVTKPITPDSLIAWFKNDPYDFKPGEQLQYNNSGYFLLGYIIGKVSGKPYETYLKETFFDPLGMKNTGVYHNGISLAPEAKGYSRGTNGYESAINWDMSWAGAAGALYSTLDDLLKWNIALHNGNVLTQKSFAAAVTPVTLSTGKAPSMRYGYGLGLNNYRDIDIIGHSGGLHGFITQLSYYPKEKLTVVMFSNSSDPEVNFDPNKIAEAFLWERLAKQQTYQESNVKPGDLNQYTGNFQIPNVGVLMITSGSDKLYAQLGGQAKYQVFPSSKDEFFWKIVEARLKFNRTEKGEVNEAVIYQNGQELKGSRMAEEKIVAIKPEVLEKYTGKYKMSDNEILVVTRNEDKLFVKPEKQSMLQLLPLSDTQFLIKEIPAKVNFIVGEGGKVSKFTLEMNGRTQEVSRVE
ncbi:MAG: serine hydrolase [Bacteroidota bacterium]